MKIILNKYFRGEDFELLNCVADGDSVAVVGDVVAAVGGAVVAADRQQQQYDVVVLKAGQLGGHADDGGDVDEGVSDYLAAYEADVDYDQLQIVLLQPPLRL